MTDTTVVDLWDESSLATAALNQSGCDDEYFIPCGLSGLSVAFIEVKDLGKGMDGFTTRRSLNPFFSTKTGQKGLGLTKVQGIMTSHKGAIGVISTPDHGTRVRLYFRCKTE